MTEGEFAAFVEDGGYARPELWSDGGLALARSATARASRVLARGDDGGWARAAIRSLASAGAERAVQHVNAFEAEACARGRAGACRPKRNGR